MTIYENVESDARVDQGDIFKDIYFPALEENVTGVVITPTCDFEHNKAQFVKFVPAVEFTFVIRIIADSVGIEESIFTSGKVVSKSQYNNPIRILRKNITGDFLPRYYLLPECSGLFPALYLDFQRVFVVPFKQLVEEYQSNRIMKVASPWREQIATRYASYSLRVGTPDYADDELRNILESAGLMLPE